MDIRDKSIVLTGATGGIGRAIARKLAGSEISLLINSAGVNEFGMFEKQNIE